MNRYENPGTGLRQEGDKPPGPHVRHGGGMVHGGRTSGAGEKGHGRGKGTSLNSASLAPRPLASSVYMHVP